MMDATFFIGQTLRIVIERPLGSHHPKYPDLIYSVNYGHVPQTIAPDGEEIDAYLLNVDTPCTEYTGQCVAVLRRLNDNDDKLIVIPENTTISDDEIRRQTEFQEKFFESIIMR